MTPHEDKTQRNKQLPPPSFTPASGRPTRPARTPAIAVGNTGEQPPVSAAPSSNQYAAGQRPGAQQPGSQQPGSQGLRGQARNVQPAALPPSIPPKGASGAQGTTSPAAGASQGHAPQSQAPQGHAPQSQAPQSQAPQSHSYQPQASGQPLQPNRTAAPRPKKRKRKTGRIIALLVVLALLAWPIGLVTWANGKLNHIEALSGASATPGTTYLIAGSDARDATIDDGNKGARADTIMLLHVPKSGPSALISLPRDIYVPIPGKNPNKINAAFSLGGAPLLVQTVEELTGMTVDHYVEVGFSGVTDLVDAVGGVELCLDYDVDDKPSELKWEAGCHMADGHKALAFSRMRKQDPLGDIGRAQRQRQVVSAVSSALKSPSKLLNPITQKNLVQAVTGAVAVSDGTGLVDLGKMALAFRSANSKSGITGTPPIISLNYRPGGVGSAVQIDEEATAQFFKDIAQGKLEPGEYNGLG